MAASPVDPDPDDRALQRIEHAPATARIPDSLGQGVFATGVIVLHGQHEFAIDFVQSLVRPQRVAARVVLPPAVASQLAVALEQSLAAYAQKFGAPPREPEVVPPPSATAQAPTSPDGSPQPASSPEQPPRPAHTPPPPSSQPPITDHYERLKLPDEMLGGAYANMVSISHTGSEFCLDFIAKFYPRAAVTTRVYMAAARVPDLLTSLKRSIGG